MGIWVFVENGEKCVVNGHDMSREWKGEWSAISIFFSLHIHLIDFKQNFVWKLGLQLIELVLFKSNKTGRGGGAGAERAEKKFVKNLNFTNKSVKYHKVRVSVSFPRRQNHVGEWLAVIN